MFDFSGAFYTTNGLDWIENPHLLIQDPVNHIIDSIIKVLLWSVGLVVWSQRQKCWTRHIGRYFKIELPVTRATITAGGFQLIYLITFEHFQLRYLLNLFDLWRFFVR